MSLFGKLHKHKLVSFVTLIVFVLVIVGVMLLFVHVQDLNKKKLAQSSTPNLKGVVTHTTNNPSQTPITSFNYKSTMVGAEPKYINLPTINESGNIEKVGVDQNGAIAAPTNVYLAGWYVNSLEPGQPGLSIIEGHVDGISSIGIFYRLSKLKVGDLYQIQLANGTNLNYLVKSITNVNVNQVSNVLFAQNPNIKSQLNLITCGGAFTLSTRSYNQRTIVVSALVSS